MTEEEMNRLTNQLMDDLPWHNAPPESLGHTWHIWHITWGDEVIYAGSSLRARWGRFRSRVRALRQRVVDASEVLRGRAYVLRGRVHIGEDEW